MTDRQCSVSSGTDQDVFTLDELIARNPAFKSPDGHLLYARALEAEGRTDAALSEYATLSQYYAGAEARLRYGQLLRRSGRVRGPRAAGAAGPRPSRPGALPQGPRGLAGAPPS
jgi:hypothetical protein